MSTTPETGLHSLDHGITVVDTGFGGVHFDAAYLIEQDGHAAFVDTGTNTSVPRLLAALAHRNLTPENVDWVIVTHVHLDHAGGAGLLLQHLPRARLVVHPRGARHLVDPAKLWAGVCAVYGEDVAHRDYGELVPVPQERVVTTDDDFVLHLGSRPLRFADTPGHARHHHCIWDQASRGWFTGDTLGVAYPELVTADGQRYGLPATSPVQFDPDALRRSIERILSADPAVVYPTHYGPVYQVRELARMVLDQVDTMVALALDLADDPDRGNKLRQALKDLYLGEIRRRGVVTPVPRCEQLLTTDIELNAQGLEVWLDSRSA